MTLRWLLCLVYGCVALACGKAAPLFVSFSESECKEHMVNKQIIRNTSLSILLDNNTTIGPVRPGYEPRNFNTYT